VTDYVRHGYNQAMAAKQRHIGFLMILMQRLVTSSTAAIRTTLEKRQALLEAPQPQANLFENTSADEWADLDGQSQVDLAMQSSGWELEKSEVEMLLELARETEAAGTDAKAEALLELIYKLQQEEGDPALKVLIFTEFVPTQAMLADYLESRGFSVATLNGSMDLETRTRAQQEFSKDVRVLISTDAGGEGLNAEVLTRCRSRPAFPSAPAPRQRQWRGAPSAATPAGSCAMASCPASGQLQSRRHRVP